MPALAAARLTESKNLGPAKAYLMAPSTQIYAGGLVMINSVGLATPALAGASNRGVVGVAQANVLSQASGNYYTVVSPGTFRLVASGAPTQAIVGQPVFSASDNDVHITNAGTEPRAGVCVEFVSATDVWVAVSPEMMQ